jgi:uncharacterized low-complexity protein
MKTLATMLCALLLAITPAVQAQPAPAAPDPVTTAIATALVAYFNSQEGQCQLHACSCDKCNQGAKNRCHEIARRLNELSKNPNQYNAQQVHGITQSRRTQCMARALVSSDTWAAIQTRGVNGWGHQVSAPPAPPPSR